MAFIQEEVKKLIQKYSSNCPFEIARSLGIIIQYGDLGNTLGFYLHDSRIKFININQYLHEILQRFVCAHELGHAILHPKANTPFLRRNTLFSVDKIEVEANTFAVELLIPDEKIYEYRNTNLSIEQLGEIFGVPGGLAHLKSFKNF